jgi:hypothetical protein
VTVQTRAAPDVMEELGRAFKGAMAAVRRMRGRETCLLYNLTLPTNSLV